LHKEKTETRDCLSYPI